MKSIRVKLIFSTLLLTVPLIALLIYTNQYAIGVVREEVAASIQQMISLYMNQVDNGLDEMDKYMNALVGAGPDLAALSRAETEEEYVRAKIYMFNKLVNDLPLYRPLNAMFVYSAARDDYLEVYNDLGLPEERERVKSYISSLLRERPDVNGFHSDSWRSYRIGDRDYLVHILQSGSVYMGAWASAEEMLGPMRSIGPGHSDGTIFVDEQGRPMTRAEITEGAGFEWNPVEHAFELAGAHDRYLVVAEHSRKGDFSLVTLVPEERILENLPFLRRITELIVVASLIVVPVGFYLLRRSVLVPINRLIIAMRWLRDGNTDAKIPFYRTSEEFRVMNETFNDMTNEIRELRIDVYEEQLAKQREELQRLQLQIKPHFFMNTLNIIYQLAKLNKGSEVQEMTLSLVHYLRFMFRSNLSFVRLAEELDMIRHYVRIQQLRFPGNLIFDLTAHDYLLDTPVPPLVAQTFVENAVKHAVTLDASIRLAVTADFVEREGQSLLKLTVRDSGKGFPPDVLEKLNAGETLMNEEGEHVGIWNVQRRLRLLYAGAADVRFENDGGAVVGIWLPIESVNRHHVRE